MGSELVGNSTPLWSDDISNNLAPTFPTYTELFYKHFPFYLAIGMTYDQYWNGDCNLPKYYKEAHNLRKQIKNEELWLQGMYFYEAMLDVSPLLHAFAKSGTKPVPYPKEPYPLSEQEYKGRQELEQRKRVEAMRQKLINTSSKKKE